LTDNDILTMLKIDLQISVTQQDTYLTNLIELAKAAIQKEGIVFNELTEEGAGKGITVEEDTKMRKQFREAGVEYKVYKNRLLLKALNELGHTGYEDILEGTTAVAFGYKDEVSGPNILVKTIEACKKMQVKCGMLNGERIDAAMVEQLAKIPSKEVLISKLLYLLQSPVRSVAIALKAIADKQ